MKRILAAILTLALVFAVFPAASARAEDFSVSEGDIETQAFCVALAAQLNDYYGGEPDPLLLWDAAGWYAAREYRINGTRLISDSAIRDFLASIGYTGYPVLPEAWESYGIVIPVTGAGNSHYYDFQQHKTMFDAMIGITSEISTSIKGPHTVESAVTIHYPDHQFTIPFRLTFNENTDTSSAFRCKLNELERLPSPVHMDETLNFTWEQLCEENRLTNILKWCPSVRFTNPGYNDDSVSWLFLDGDSVVFSIPYGENISGTYRNYSFDTFAFSDDKIRASIGAVSDDPEGSAYHETIMLDYLENVVDVQVSHEEDGLLWLNCWYAYGTMQQIAIDPGTLFIRQVSYQYSPDYEASVTVFDYNNPAPEYAILSGWKEPLRTVSAIWEKYDEESGTFTYHTQTLEIPGDWEYLPYAARWGEYTPYLDARYTQSYSYPGDNIDYTIFLTAAKG